MLVATYAGRVWLPGKSYGGKPRAVVRRREVERGAQRQYAPRVEVAHAAVIAELDLVEIDGRGYSRHLVDLAGVVRQIVVVGQSAQIALEQHVIDRIEAY